METPSGTETTAGGRNVRCNDLLGVTTTTEKIMDDKKAIEILQDRIDRNCYHEPDDLGDEVLGAMRHAIQRLKALDARSKTNSVTVTTFGPGGAGPSRAEPESGFTKFVVGGGDFGYTGGDFAATGGWAKPGHKTVWRKIAEWVRK